MKKNYYLGLLIIVLILSSCSQNKVDTSVNSNNKNTEKSTNNPKKNGEDSMNNNLDTDDLTNSNTSSDSSSNNGVTDGTQDVTTQDSVNDQKPQSKPIRDITAFELVKELRIGWNLGNTLDATGKGLTSEISWGNPFTSKENIDKVKEAGFNVIRIPTTWENHLTSTVTYTINPQWLERVKEVVDYGIDNDMYVILNLHHEEWHFPSYDNADNAKEIFISVWTQIGNYFEGYDEHLIFEGMNEPRLKGTSYEWTSGTAESRDVINQFNLTFVHTIRSLGGNNSKRHLMIPPYAASSNKDAWDDFIIPNDDKIIVSIHGYTPYDFALNKKGTSEFNPKVRRQTKDIDELMENIDTYFLQKKIPVIIGETGAVDKGNLEQRIIWSTYYIKKATEKGIPCIWWDNGAFSSNGETFGLLDRRNNTWVFPEILDALFLGLEPVE